MSSDTAEQLDKPDCCVEKEDYAEHKTSDLDYRDSVGSRMEFDAWWAPNSGVIGSFT